jgi:predicted short-subunit dehydrogenase-like oxidoreductase (DUF2520 family)
LNIDTQRYCVIGPGRLGSTLVAAMGTAGLRVSAVGVRDAAAKPHAQPPRLPVAQAALAAEVLWLAVPDDAVRAVAAAAADAVNAAGEASRPTFAIHSSGAGRLELLEPLAAAGTRPLCLHPLQTFAEVPSPGTLAGVPCAVTASDQESARLGDQLARRLGMTPFALSDDSKGLYHLAAAVASNLLVALESEAARLLDEATGGADGLHILAPLVSTTLHNLIDAGPARALTGPVARGDVGTVRAHLRLLEHEAPRLASAYRALSLEALAIAAPRLDDETVRTLKRLLDDTARQTAPAIGRRPT